MFKGFAYARNERYAFAHAQKRAKLVILSEFS